MHCSISLPNYELFCNNRQTQRGGGVAIYVKSLNLRSLKKEEQHLRPSYATAKGTSMSADLLAADWSCNYDNIDSMYNTFLPNNNNAYVRHIPLKETR